MKLKVFTAVVAAQFFLISTPAWADNDNGLVQPHISDIGGGDHSPGVTLVIILALLLIGFGVGFVFGRRTRNK